MMPTPIPTISVRELKDQQATGDAPFLLDVRQPGEYEIANLGGSLIPLPELPERLEELEPHRDEQIVVHCHHGQRSAKAVQFLRAQGYDAVNLEGGIDAWSKEIDASVPTY